MDLLEKIWDRYESETSRIFLGIRKITFNNFFICLIVFFSSTAISFLLIFILKKNPLNKPGDIAAWVQAIGSILAIGAAIWVGTYQSISSRKMLQTQWKQDEKVRKQTNIASLKSKVDIAILVTTNIKKTCGSISTSLLAQSEEARKISAATRCGLEILEKMDLESVPGVFIAENVLDLKFVIQEYLLVLEDIKNTNTVTKTHKKIIHDIYQSAVALQDTMSETYGEYTGGWSITPIKDEARDEEKGRCHEH